MRISLITLLLFFFGFVLHAQNSSVQAELDKKLTQQFGSKEEPGVSVLVMEKGKVVLKKGYGYSNLEKKEAINPDDVFRIGSITKQFTSTAILKLVEQRKINLNDDISKYLPDFKTTHPVTVEQLLNHTSGIKSYTSLPEIMSTESKKKKMTINEMLSVIQKQPADFAPGEQWLYNNSGYFLLGAILEKVTGMTYRDYITKTFFKPLGMKSSFVDDAQPIANLVTGYARKSATEFTIADYVDPSIPYSAGSIFSTVDDLYKWNQAIFSYKLVKKDLLEKAWTPTQLKNGALESYGYGWQLGRVGTLRAIGHGGGIDGFVSFEVYVPEKQIYVCVLANTGLPIEDIAYSLLETTAGATKQKPEPVVLNASELEQYIGVYSIDANQERVITYKEGKVYSQRTGGDRLEIYPYTKDKFAFKESNSEILFTRNSDGSIAGMQLIGRDWVQQTATRTNKPIPADRVAITLSAEEFDVFAGEYELAPGFILKVWREENQFKTQATGQPPFDIYPESSSKFFLKVVDAQLEFNRNDQGEVTGLTLFQGGRQMPAKKIN